MKSPCLLLLTACIDPGAAAGQQVKRRDPAVRLRDYVNALTFWLTLRDPRLRHILLVENSGHPLDALHEVVRRYKSSDTEVELLHAGSNDIPDGHTYAYPESRMIDAAVQTSRLWAESPDVVIKLTGRLTFPALPRLLDRIPEDLVFCGDSVLNRDAWKFWSKPTQMHSWLFISRKQFFEENIQRIWMRMRPERGYRSFEDVLFRRIDTYDGPDRDRILFRLPINCDPIGVAGYNDRDTRDYKRRLMQVTRAAARRATPWWWI